MSSNFGIANKDYLKGFQVNNLSCLIKLSDEDSEGKRIVTRHDCGIRQSAINANSRRYARGVGGLAERRRFLDIVRSGSKLMLSSGVGFSPTSRVSGWLNRKEIEVDFLPWYSVK